ncbi:hypothetical protein M9458_056710 [Cirrhinus mrigala]|uniref:Uncharacterized protein n=1 Tax=Cirrhinus mrigala TaxID=683832 RepID=A0ABD0MCK4_CIRMR
MALLSKVLASLSFRLPKWHSARKSSVVIQKSSHIQKPIQKPSEDIEVEIDERDCQVSSAEMEIFQERKTPPAGVKLPPLLPISTVAKPLMIRVAPAEVETLPFTPTTVVEPLMNQVAQQNPAKPTRNSKKKRRENPKTPSPSAVRDAWMETSNMQGASPKNKRLGKPIRKEKGTKNNHPEHPPTMVKLAWTETSNTQVSHHEQATKAEEDSEPETTVEMLTLADRKKERKIEHQDKNPPPATLKLAWMEKSKMQAMHLKEVRPKRQESSLTKTKEESITLIEYTEEDNRAEEHKKQRKTEQADKTASPAKEKCVRMEGDKKGANNTSYVKQPGPDLFLNIYTMSELKAYEKKMRKLKKEQKQRESPHEPSSMKDHLINKFKKFKRAI